MRWLTSLCCALALFAAAAFAADAKRGMANFQANFPDVGIYQTATRIGTIYGPAFGFGESPEQVAADFITQNAAMFGVDAGDLEPVSILEDARHTQPVMPDRVNGGYKFTLVYYSQFRGGFPVYRADVRMLVRNEPGYPLVLVKNALRDVGDFRPNAQAPMRMDLAEAAAKAQFPEMVNVYDPELVVWAGIDDTVVQPALAIKFVADNGPEGAVDRQKFLFLADAATGEILYSENLVYHIDVTGTTKGLATVEGRAQDCASEVSTPLPYVRVSISGGSTAYSDANGNFTIPNGGSSPVTVQSTLIGRWFTVRDTANGNSRETLSLNVTPPGPANFLHNASNTQFIAAQVNGYLHANTVRDTALAANPTYPGVNGNMSVYVNISSSCNAYYDGNINFFRDLGGCNNTAFGDVVDHEYGHHLVNVGGSGQGQYGEGMGDVMALIHSERSQMGIGFSSCSSGIRNADNNKQYPCGGEIHDCGQLISGCYWSTREELLVTEPADYLQILRDLSVNSILLHNGTEITPQITIDWLTLDDDNGNINDGTPHYQEIATGFGAHSMPAPELIPLEFDYLNGQPSTIDPAGEIMLVQIRPHGSLPQSGSGRFFYDIGSGFVEGTMVHLGTNLYEVHFPATPCGTNLSYYLTALTTSNVTIYDPLGAPANSYSTASAEGSVVVIDEPFESGDNGWTVGAPDDDAPRGLWERANPEGTAAQPEDDHTSSGTQCWVTGPLAGDAIGSYDVDLGKTTLLSPVFDGLPNGRISYWRWYSNDQGNYPDEDVFTVDISNDGGQSWVNVEEIGPDTDQSSGGWFFHEFLVGSVIEPTGTMQVRFVASDYEGASVVEAAVDDFAFERFDCGDGLKGDLNCDGSIDGADIEAFFLAIGDPAGYETQYPDCDRLNADMNGDNGVDGADIDPFFDCLGNGNCP